MLADRMAASEGAARACPRENVSQVFGHEGYNTLSSGVQFQREDP